MYLCTTCTKNGLNHILDQSRNDNNLTQTKLIHKGSSKMFNMQIVWSDFHNLCSAERWKSAQLGSISNCEVNNYIVRSYRIVIVVTNIVISKTINA